MKKMLSIISIIALSSFLFAENAELSVCGITDDGAGSVIFDICANSTVDVAGFQFDFGVTSGATELTLTGASGGEAAATGFTVSTSALGTVLGFSFTGSTMSANSQDFLMTSISATYEVNDDAVVDFATPVMTGTDTGVSVTTTTVPGDWSSGTLDADSVLPSVYSLTEAYPNPFNPTTTIDYTLRENGNVSIVVYDLMGRIVRELVNEFQFADGGTTHSVVWNGADNSGNMVSSGIYIYRMISNDFTKSHRITLMK